MTPDPTAAQGYGQRFQGRVGCLHDCDADGLSAGVLWQRTAERLGVQPLRAVVDRERNAWNAVNRERARALDPENLFVLDLGCRPEKVLEGVPTCFVDHHHPDGVLSEDLLLSGYGLDPCPTTSLLVYELGSALTDLSDLDWLAALGAIGDLGDKAPFPLVTQARARYKLKWLKEAVVLINAPRRASDYQPEAAARALLEHDGPRALVESTSSDVQLLRHCREELLAAMTEGKKAAPRFSGQVALVQVSSACQIHPLLAQIWRGRLPRYHVLVANTGYLPGKVNFSGRSSGILRVRELLRAHEPEGEEIGRGHDQASGGSLSFPAWEEFLKSLGF